MTKKSYSRKDEGPTPWMFNTLSTSIQDSTTTIQGFYPLQKFATHNKLFSLPKPIHFPPTMLVSNNYFKTGWSFNTYRRIRNTIIVMDWIPDVGTNALRLREMHDMYVFTKPTMHTRKDDVAGLQHLYRR